MPGGDWSLCAVPVPCHLTHGHPCLPGCCLHFFQCTFPDGQTTGFSSHSLSHSQRAYLATWLPASGFHLFSSLLTSADLMPATDFWGFKSLSARRGKWTVKYKDSFYQFKYILFENLLKTHLFCLKTYQHLSASHCSICQYPWPCWTEKGSCPQMESQKDLSTITQGFWAGD